MINTRLYRISLALTLLSTQELIYSNSKEKGKLEQNYKGEPHNEETFVGASLVAQG